MEKITPEDGEALSDESTRQLHSGDDHVPMVIPRRSTSFFDLDSSSDDDNSCNRRTFMEKSPAMSKAQISILSNINDSNASLRTGKHTTTREPQNSQNTDRNNYGDNDESEATRQYVPMDTDSSLDVQRVEKMVEGIEDVEAKFKEVVSRIYAMLREPDLDMNAIQLLCSEWTKLQRTFSKITQDSIKMATRGAQTIKDFIDHCNLVARDDCPIDDRIKILRDFKSKIESDDNIIGGEGGAMYDIDSAFNELRLEVQNFGFKLLAVRQPIGENLLAQIASSEDEICKVSKDMKFLKRHISDRGGGIKVVLSAFLMGNKEETIDNLDNAELDRKRGELDEAYRRKNIVEKQWSSISVSCSEYIQQIGGQLGAISDTWKGLCSDGLMLEEQLYGNVRKGINPHLFGTRIQIIQTMYKRLYSALMDYSFLEVEIWTFLDPIAGECSHITSDQLSTSLETPTFPTPTAEPRGRMLPVSPWNASQKDLQASIQLSKSTAGHNVGSCLKEMKLRILPQLIETRRDFLKKLKDLSISEGVDSYSSINNLSMIIFSTSTYVVQAFVNRRWGQKQKDIWSNLGNHFGLVIGKKQRGAVSFRGDICISVAAWSQLSPLQAIGRIHELQWALNPVIINMTRKSQITWAHLIQETVEFDIAEMKSVLVERLDNKSSEELSKEFHALTDDEVSGLGYVLQFFNECSRDDDPLYERALKLLVKERNVLPSHLYLKDDIVVSQTDVKGGGGFADVYKGLLRGQYVAFKVLGIINGITSEELHTALCKESTIWGRFNHPNILPFYGICNVNFVGPRFAMVSPWMENGSLPSYMKNHSELVDREKIITGIARGLNYLHSRFYQVIHGDLRADNVLVDADGTPMLSDFGLARVIDPLTTGPFTSFKGQGCVRWQAPELFQYEGSASPRFTAKTDVYAFACVILEVYTCKKPYSDIPYDPQVLREKLKGVHPSRPDEPELGDGLWEIMEKCWFADPEIRPDMAKVVDLLTGIMHCPPTPSRRVSFHQPLTILGRPSH